MKICTRWSLARLALGLLALYATSAARAQDLGEDCEGATFTAPVESLNNSGVTGTATLCISENGIHTRIAANNLTAGHPYTVWFLYFDDPLKCLIPGHCTPADFTIPAADPEGVLGRYDSIVAGGSTGRFSGHVGGLQPSSGSVIAFAIFSHGSLSADGRLRARQLLTPQDPSLGAPGLGTSSDGTIGRPVAHAIFHIP